MNIVAITACPSGVAHTYMAAESLEQAAIARGWTIKVETQGALGAENEISVDDVARADAVILTTDIELNGIERFEGKKVIQSTVKRLVVNPSEALDAVEA
ncbi:PTS fructose transporter subunit IIB [Enterovibrio nigricans]|uniref:protein-N(pi)-phosphohistidine--D-fructose phosphotransferase n=1 Tax=Enterovibrio nigricans DSM 22720 TaxID=1121868 RepID=A0A1T4UNK1_9GAMM|nr:PTS fructose transporter subunit IIB [Enterovibrio nigricans]SKA54297.1 PTS system, fructose-specific IIB-like component [Enterovibrio nigricans DSM 22720]